MEMPATTGEFQTVTEKIDMITMIELIMIVIELPEENPPLMMGITLKNFWMNRR